MNIVLAEGGKKVVERFCFWDDLRKSLISSGRLLDVSESIMEHPHSKGVTLLGVVTDQNDLNPLHLCVEEVLHPDEIRHLLPRLKKISKISQEAVETVKLNEIKKR